MTPEDRERIEAIRERQAEGRYGGTVQNVEDSAWLLDLVERQESERQLLAEVLSAGVTVLHRSGCLTAVSGQAWRCHCDVERRAGVIAAFASGERVVKREELGRTKDEIS